MSLRLVAPPHLQAQGIKEMTSDVYNIALRVKDIDPNLTLSISAHNTFVVTYDNPEVGKRFFILEAEECDPRILEELERGNMQGVGWSWGQFERDAELAQEAEDRENAHMSHEAAKDLALALTLDGQQQRSSFYMSGATRRLKGRPQSNVILPC